MRQAFPSISATLVVLACVSPVWAKERQNVTISYVVGPSRPVPEGLHAVAVINSGVSTQGMQQDEREAKWSVMAADMIEAMLQAGSSTTAQPLMVAKRSETQAVLREHDMALAGMVASDQAATAAKLLAVQGLITSRIVVQIDEQRGTKSTLDWMSIMGGAVRETVSGRSEAPAPAPAPRPGVLRRPSGQVRRGADGRLYTVQRGPVYRGNPAQVYAPGARSVSKQERSAAGGGLTIATKDVEEISRSLTVQCSFTLIDAATGQAILQYSPPPARKQDRQSPDFFFGSMMGDKELDPVDHFIGELVERATQEFVSMLVPVQVQYTYELTARHSASEEALRALRADDYAGALASLEKDHRKYSDEHEIMFSLGVVNELMGRHEQGLQWYRKALASKDVDEEEVHLYTAAKDRLAAHMGRILPPAPPGGILPTPQSAAPATAVQAAPAPAPAQPQPAADQIQPPAHASPAQPQPLQPAPGEVPAPVIEESHVPD